MFQVQIVDGLDGYVAIGNVKPQLELGQKECSNNDLLDAI